MVAVRSSETSVIPHVTRRRIPVHDKAEILSSGHSDGRRRVLKPGKTFCLLHVPVLLQAPPVRNTPFCFYCHSYPHSCSPFIATCPFIVVSSANDSLAYMSVLLESAMLRAVMTLSGTAPPPLTHHATCADSRLLHAV
jgi:hypothetical protein